ncbi:hypothetical protein [Bacillus cereus]|uniref:hypothetical protein n=1 Tax=Bacillus cereus TaxID=1396 RepID=UPI0013FD4F8A|nr:hypothetical protein [Bacillus cereus]
MRRRAYGRNDGKEMDQQKCTCDHLQQELPMCYGSDTPFQYYSISKARKKGI